MDMITGTVDTRDFSELQCNVAGSTQPPERRLLARLWHSLSERRDENHREHKPAASRRSAPRDLLGSACTRRSVTFRKWFALAAVLLPIASALGLPVPGGWTPLFKGVDQNSGTNNSRHRG